MEAFVRMDKAFVNLRSRVVNPHYVIVMGEKLVHSIGVSAGIQRGGFMLINSSKEPGAFDFPAQDFELETMDVNRVAVKNGLGSRTSPFINTPILGAFVGFTELVKPESIIRGIRKFILTNAEKNIAGFREAYALAREKVKTRGI